MVGGQTIVHLRALARRKTSARPSERASERAALRIFENGIICK